MVQFTKQKSLKNKIYQTDGTEQSVRLQNTFHTKKKHREKQKLSSLSQSRGEYQSCITHTQHTHTDKGTYTQQTHASKLNV